MDVLAPKCVVVVKESTTVPKIIKCFTGETDINCFANNVRIPRFIKKIVSYLLKKLFITAVEVEGEHSAFTLPEFEIIIEDEKMEVKQQSRLDERDKAELLEFEKILESKKPTFQSDTTVDESLEESVSGVREDKMFLKFKDKIASYPDQVLRYDKGEKPVWVSDSNMPLSVPDCEHCGSKRAFEFQVIIFFFKICIQFQ